MVSGQSIYDTITLHIQRRTHKTYIYLWDTYFTHRLELHLKLINYGKTYLWPNEISHAFWWRLISPFKILHTSIAKIRRNFITLCEISRKQNKILHFSWTTILWNFIRSFEISLKLPAISHVSKALRLNIIWNPCYDKRSWEAQCKIYLDTMDKYQNKTGLLLVMLTWLHPLQCQNPNHNQRHWQREQSPVQASHPKALIAEQ